MERNHKKKSKHRNVQDDDTLNYYKRIEEVLRSSGDKNGNALNGEVYCLISYIGLVVI